MSTWLDDMGETRSVVGAVLGEHDESMPQLGDVVGEHYRVRDVLGMGGMGTVYLARDERLGRDVALKVIRADKATDGTVLESFAKEARAMASVRHPNVVTIHAIGDWRGRPFFVMERVPGPTLGEWRRERPPLTVAEAIGVLDPLCHAVEAIHQSGAIHRDLKPGNVLIGPGGRVAVTDFGLAQPLSLEGGDPYGMSGTPAYLAPELGGRRSGDPDLARRADVYALAVMAFELLTGKAPYAAKSVNAMLLAHAFDDIPAASERCPELSPAFDDVLRRGLAKDPDERTATARQLRRELLAAAAKAEANPLRILVADDDQATRATVTELLEVSFPEVEVLIAGDAKAALAMARERKPDVVITDLEMPHGGGDALTETLRKDPLTAQTPIVVITGHGGAEDWQRLRKRGADRCLLKPIDVDALVAVIGSLTARSQP